MTASTVKTAPAKTAPAKTAPVAEAPAAEAAPVAPYIFTVLPKGAKLLGGAEDKFEAFSPAGLTRATKVKAYLKAVLEGGQEGRPASAVASETGIKESNLGPYPSYDLRKKGIRIGKLPNGNLIVVARDGYREAEEQAILFAIVGAA